MMHADFSMKASATGIFSAMSFTNFALSGFLSDPSAFRNPPCNWAKRIA